MARPIRLALFTCIIRSVCLSGLGTTFVKGNAVGIDRNVPTIDDPDKFHISSDTHLTPYASGWFSKSLIGIKYCAVCRYVTTLCFHHFQFLRRGISRHLFTWIGVGGGRGIGLLVGARSPSKKKLKLNALVESIAKIDKMQIQPIINNISYDSSTGSKPTSFFRQLQPISLASLCPEI